MNIDDAFREYSLIDHRFSEMEPVEQVYDRYIVKRYNINGIWSDPVALDIVKVVQTFNANKEHIKHLSEDIEKCKKTHDNISVELNNIKKAHKNCIQLMQGSQPLKEEDSKEVRDGFDAYYKVLTGLHEKWLDMYQQIQNKRNMELRLIDESMAATRMLLAAGVSELAAKENLKMSTCPVCFDAEINTCLVPCGHTVCDNCYNLRGKCGICRAPIKESVKMFMY